MWAWPESAALDEKRHPVERYCVAMSQENVEVRNEAVRRFFAAFEDEAPPPRAADPTPNNRRKQK
jgi:oligoendopeptidase F